MGEKLIANYGLFSLSLNNVGGPLLLMELAFLLRGVGSDVIWITFQKRVESDEVIYSLENKMLDRGVQVIPPLLLCISHMHHYSFVFPHLIALRLTVLLDNIYPGPDIHQCLIYDVSSYTHKHHSDHITDIFPS